MKIKKKDLLILLLFICLTFFLRLSAFFLSGIGPDESIYLLMARSLTEGNPPYTEFFDNKPIGIYFIFASALLLFGNSVVSIRIAAAIAVSITCFLLYKIGNLLTNNNQKIGLIAGILYAFTTIGSGGISSDTVIFFAPFATLAYYLCFSLIILPDKPILSSKAKLLLIGLLMGIGLLIKQVIIFEFIGVMILLSLTFYKQNQSDFQFILTNIVKAYAILVFGLIIPFTFNVIYFFINGHFSNFLYANITANLARVGGENLSFSSFFTGFLIQLKDNLLLWTCLLLIPLFWKNKDITSEEKRNITYLFIWLVMAFLGVCAPKSFYTHYFLQLLPSLCLLSAYIIIQSIWNLTGIDTAKRLIIIVLILVTPLLSIFYPFLRFSAKSVYSRYLKGVENWGDSPAIIAQYLRERVSPNDYIYVVDYWAVIYYLVPARIPTKYAYPEFLVSPKLSQVAGVNSIQELHAIMAKKPTYIIKFKNSNGSIEESMFYKELKKYLTNNYWVEKEIPIYDDIIRDDELSTSSVEILRLKNQDKN